MDGAETVESCELPVQGMTCAACAARIEKNLNRAPGVRQARVNFATNRAAIEYDPRQTGRAGLAEVIKYGLLGDADLFGAFLCFTYGPWRGRGAALRRLLRLGRQRWTGTKGKP